MALNNWEIALFLFATIGPLKVTIVCAALTADADPQFVRRVALHSVLRAAAVCLVFALFGDLILKMFKVSVPAFQVGGGLVVLIYALEMAGPKAKKTSRAGSAKDPESNQSLDIATSPLAVPNMASISGLVAIVSVLAQGETVHSVLFLIVLITAIMAINYACLCQCRGIAKLLGPVAMEIIGKLMGLMLASMAVELIASGLIGLGIVHPSSTGPEKPTPVPAVSLRLDSLPAVMNRADS